MSFLQALQWFTARIVLLSLILQLFLPFGLRLSHAMSSLGIVDNNVNNNIITAVHGFCEGPNFSYDIYWEDTVGSTPVEIVNTTSDVLAIGTTSPIRVTIVNSTSAIPFDIQIREQSDIANISQIVSVNPKDCSTFEIAEINYDTWAGAQTPFVVPTGVTHIRTSVIGGGGNGSRNSGGRARAGGWGGASAISTFTVVANETFDVTVGAGRTAFQSGSANAGSSIITNNAGKTVSAQGGRGLGQGNSNGGTGGTASASVGQQKFSGGNGGNGASNSNSSNDGKYGRWGGAAHYTGAGTNGSQSSAGTSVAPGGNGWTGGVGGTNGAGRAHGGGGAGHNWFSTGNGGVGADGHARIETYDTEVVNPTVSIETWSGQADPDTVDNTVIFTATFSEPITVSSFTCDDITFSWSTTATCSSIIETSIDGTVFDITTVATTNGTIIASIPEAAVHDIAWNNNVASTSSDNIVEVNVVTEAPGWIATDLQFWVKADEWVFLDTGATPATDSNTVQTWHDQSPVENDLNQPASANRPTFISQFSNFNPGLSFNASQSDVLAVDRGLDGSLDDTLMGNLSGTNPIEVFTVSEADADIQATIFYLGNTAGTADTLWTFGVETSNRIVTRDNSGNQLRSISGVTTDPHIFNWQTNSNGQIGSTVMESDGWATIFSSQANETSVTNLAWTRIAVGARQSWGNPNLLYDGVVSEVIAYGTTLSVTQRQQVQSYLALKYGITLDQTSAQDYLSTAGTGTFMWDSSVATVYNNDIFGIGRDDSSELDQRIAKSANDEAIVTISTNDGSADFATANSASRTAHTADLDFQVVANNGGAASWWESVSVSIIPIDANNTPLVPWNLGGQTLSDPAFPITSSFFHISEDPTLPGTPEDTFMFTEGETKRLYIVGPAIDLRNPGGTGLPNTNNQISGFAFDVTYSSGTFTYAEVVDSGTIRSTGFSNIGTLYITTPYNDLLPAAWGVDEVGVFDNSAIANAFIENIIAAPTNFQISERIWQIQENGTGGPINIQFDVEDTDFNIPALLTGTGYYLVQDTDADTDFSDETPIALTNTSGDFWSANIDFTDNAIFTLATRDIGSVEIEFESATASDDENIGGNLPRFFIDGVLATDTTIDVITTASGSATLGTDYELNGLSGWLPQTTTVTIPAGSYNGTAVDLNIEAFNETYANVTNPPAVFPQDSFVAPVTGDYTLTLSADVADINSGNAWVRVGTTFVASGWSSFGASDIFNGLANGTTDRISATTPSQSFTISLVAGTTYHTTVGAWGGGNVDNLNLLIAQNPFDFSIIGDTDFESDETISLTLTNAQGNLVIADVDAGGLIDNHVYTITNDDVETIGPGGVDKTGLTLWLDADDASTLYQEAACTNLATNTQGVGCWQDKSGQWNDVTGTAEPTVLAWELNGKTTLDFAVDSLVTSGGGQITSNSSYTKFAVVKFDAGGSNNIISSSPGNHAFWGNGGTQIAMWHGGTFVNSANLWTTNYQIGVGRYGNPDGETNIINVDGTEAASNTLTRNFNATTSIIRIGSHGAGNNLNGQLAEAIVYDRALTDDEIDDVECYLSGKWGIPVSSGCLVEASTNNLTVDENAGSETFTVVLGEQPTTDVVVDVISGDIVEATVNPATLTFTNTNWNIPQTVTVTGVDDVDVGDGTTTVTVVVDDALSDDEFDGAPDVIVNITLTDDDAIGPGWVTSNIAVWLKADSGITGNPITAWDNSFLSGITPSVVGTPDFEAESINFNPGVSFQGISTLEYINFGNIVNGWTAGQAFMVGAQENEDVVNANETGIWRIGGNSNSHITWTNELIYESFGNSSRINNIATPYSTHIPHLYSASHSDANQSNLHWNGETIHSSTRGTRFANEPVWLARGRWGGRYLGDIPEFILFDTALSDVDEQKVHSYLALKYGLSLDQTTPTDYIASDGITEMWDSDVVTANTYNHNIAGIGRDDDSGLWQVKSRSSTPGSLVTIEAEGEWTNLVNAFSEIDNLEFLTWANDNESIAILSTEVPATIPAAASGRIPREWQVQHEGDVGSVTVSFDLGDQALFDIALASDYALLLDSDGDFSDATVYTTWANINGDEISFTGVSLTDGMYFTLAWPPKPAPGGVGAALWLKANEGTDTTSEWGLVTTWSDQAGNNDALGTGTARPTYEDEPEDQLNFNPTLRFDGSNDYLGITRNFPERNYSHLIVYKTTDAIGSLSAIVSPVVPGAGAVDRNFSLASGRLNHRLWSEQRIAGGANLNNDIPHIASVTVANGIGQTVYSDGAQVAFGNKDFSNFTWQTGMVLGNNRYHGALTGDIAEVIFVDTALDAVSQNRAESYLALKYGITLDQTTPTDYRSSNGSLIFDATAAMNGYRNDIAGIGQDDGSDLNQTQSQSENDDAIVTIGNASSQDNNDFLMWGNNNGSLSQVTTNLPTTWPVSRLDRIWKIEETNDIGTVDVSIDISSLGITSTSAARLWLIVDSDTDFTSWTTVETGDNLTGSGVVTFNAVDFSDGDYFTLGIIPVNIGDKIWSDVDGNGVQSGTWEIGVSWITVSLYRDDGATAGTFDGDETLVVSTTTSANGDYDFTGLDAGDYWVNVTDDASWLTWAPQTWGNAEPELISTVGGEDYNDADYGYRFTPPPVTDGNISVNAGSGTSGIFIVGDTVVVSWNASATWDTQPHQLRSVLVDISTFWWWSQTPMTDTTACWGIAGDNIYEACITYSAGVIDADNLNPSVTVSNAGATTGPIADSTNSSVDNQPPVFSTSGLSIVTDNSVTGIAAINGDGTSADSVRVNATVVWTDGDTITWDATVIGGSSTQANNTTVTLSSGTFEDFSATFDVTVTDNAGNTFTLNTENIDNNSVSVDTKNPDTPIVNTSPATATLGDPVTTDITWVEEAASIQIAGMSCSPNPADATGVVSCSGIAGTGGLVSSNGVITITDGSGNINTTATTNLTISNNFPVITLSGGAEINHEVNTVYTDLWASANDVEDGDITGSITNSGSVDVTTLWSYTISYDVTDLDSNNAVQVNRIVNVVDTTAPIITLDWSGSVEVLRNTTYADPWAICIDNHDISCSVATSGTVDVATLGAFVTYDVTDSNSNNAVQVTRVVNVVDTTPPIITITGSGTITIPKNASYTDLWSTCSDNFDTNCNVTSSGTVDTSTIWLYTIDYDAIDTSGNIAITQARVVDVVSWDTPIITLNGSGSITQEVGTSYTDLGVIYTDTEDGTWSLAWSWAVDISTVGVYTIIYNFTDSSDNVASQVTRTVNIVDTTPPTLISWSLDTIPTSAWATIAWQTNEPTSSEVVYGLTTVTDSTTGEQNIAPRVTSHSLTLADLRSCTTYHYQIISRDASGNELIDGIHTFTTEGCAWWAQVLEETSTDVIPTGTWATGSSTLTLGSGPDLLEIEVPVWYFDTGSWTCGWDGVFFQLKQLQEAPVVTTLWTPWIRPVTLKTYDLSAYCNASEQIEEFDQQITVTMSYDNDDVTLFNEEDVRIFRYDTGLDSWEILSECSVNLAWNNVTCKTDHFSTFGVFTIISDPSSIWWGSSLRICTDPAANNYQKSGISDSSVCRYDQTIVPTEEKSEHQVVTSVDDEEIAEEKDIEPELLQPWLENTESLELPEEEIESVKPEDIQQKSTDANQEYTLVEDYQNCSIISDINDPNYLYQDKWVFIDEESSVHMDQILRFSEIGIVNGYPDGTFQPTKDITRAEFLKVVLQTHCFEYSDQAVPNINYIDVDKDSWQAKVIYKGQELDIINGDSLSYDVALIDKNLWRQYSLGRIQELKRVFTELGLYSGDINGYYTDDFIDVIYEFQVQEGIMRTPYDVGAWFWWDDTRKAFFAKYPSSALSVFRPNDVISKAEAIKILMKMSGIQAITPEQLWYRDVTTDWHIPYVRTWQTLWLFTPWQENFTFNPDDGVTRQDMIHFISKLVELYK